MDTYFVFVLNVRDCLSYDLIFVKDSPDLSLVSPSNTEVIFEELDPSTYKGRGEEARLPYLCKLSGVSVTSRIDVSRTKYDTLLWMQRSDCVLDCVVTGVDNYGRLLVNLSDSRGDKLSDMLCGAYPTTFSLR